MRESGLQRVVVAIAVRENGLGRASGLLYNSVTVGIKGSDGAQNDRWSRCEDFAPEGRARISVWKGRCDEQSPEAEGDNIVTSIGRTLPDHKIESLLPSDVVFNRTSSA